MKCFQGNSIFTGKLAAEDDIYETELGTTDVELTLSDTLEEKFHCLDIQAELSVSILCGLVSLSGSGKYLDEKRKTTKSSSMSLIYKINTINEEVYLRQLKNLVDFDGLETSTATHVLTSIDWGAVCTVTAEYSFCDTDEKKKVEGALRAEMNKLKGSVDISGSAEVHYDDKNLKKGEQFKFYSKCDVGGGGNDLPVNFQEAVNMAKSRINSRVK